MSCTGATILRPVFQALAVVLDAVLKYSVASSSLITCSHAFKSSPPISDAPHFLKCRRLLSRFLHQLVSCFDRLPSGWNMSPGRVHLCYWSSRVEACSTFCVYDLYPTEWYHPLGCWKAFSTFPLLRLVAIVCFLYPQLAVERSGLFGLGLNLYSQWLFVQFSYPLLLDVCNHLNQELAERLPCQRN